MPAKHFKEVGKNSIFSAITQTMFFIHEAAIEEKKLNINTCIYGNYQIPTYQEWSERAYETYEQVKPKYKIVLRDYF